MTKVLFYCPTVGRGGVSRVVETLSAAIERIKPGDWQFDVLGQTYNEIGLPVKYPESWAFTQLRPGPNIPAHPHQFAWLNNHAEVFVKHLREVQAGYDLIFCPSPWWTMRVQNFSVITVPFVTVIPDFAFDHINMGGLSGNFRYVAREVAKHATMTVFPSDYHRKWGEKFYGFRPAKTRTIHHSADFVARHFEATFEEGQRVREKYGLPERYVLAFHCTHHKDPITILHGHRLAMKELENPPALVIGGIGTEHFISDEPHEGPTEAVRHAIRQLGYTVGEDLFVVGQIPDEDIAGLYVGAACAVSASRSEGDLSGTIFEAFMASTPMIFSDLEVFTDRLGTEGEYGLHFPVGDAKWLAGNIVEVITHPEMARRRALRAFGYANSRNAEDVAADYLSIFAHVLLGADQS